MYAPARLRGRNPDIVHHERDLEVVAQLHDAQLRVGREPELEPQRRDELGQSLFCACGQSPETRPRR